MDDTPCAVTDEISDTRLSKQYSLVGGCPQVLEIGRQMALKRPNSFHKTARLQSYRNFDSNRVTQENGGQGDFAPPR